MAVIDIIRISLIAFVSMFGSAKKYPARSWPTEFTFRLAKRLLRESAGKPIPWLRARQGLLKLYSPALLKVIKKQESIDSVECLSFTPKSVDDAKRVIVYFHGGGYVIGSPSSYSLTLAKIALASKAKVIGVGYRLAPEHEIPAAQNDCLAATKSILCDEQYKGKKIILMGDSAGGGLCLSVLKGLSDDANHQSEELNTEEFNKVAACVLISPWLAAADQAKLERANEESDMLDSTMLSHWTDTILTDRAKQIRFLDFTEMDVSILPPLYIQSAELEVFSKQIFAFVARLKQAQVDVKHDVFEQQFHVFQTLAPLVKEADDAILRIGSCVKKY